MTTLICATLQLVAVKDQKKAYYTKKIYLDCKKQERKTECRNPIRESQKYTHTHTQVVLLITKFAFSKK